MKLHEALYVVPVDVLFIEIRLRDIRYGVRDPRLLFFGHMSPEVMRKLKSRVWWSMEVCMLTVQLAEDGSGKVCYVEVMEVDE